MHFLEQIGGIAVSPRYSPNQMQNENVLTRIRAIDVHI